MYSVIRDNIPDNFSNRNIFSLTRNRLMLINLQSNSDYTWAYEIKIEIKKKKKKFGSSRIRTRDELVARISPCLSIT